MPKARAGIHLVNTTPIRDQPLSLPYPSAGCPTFRGFRKVGITYLDDDLHSSQNEPTVRESLDADCMNAHPSKTTKGGAAALMES
jgi:hypothetical protein